MPSDNPYKSSTITDLLNAQKEIEGVTKTGTNPFFHSDYATLNDVIDSCKKILNNHNFIVLQPLESDADGVYVCTTLIHISGEKLVSKMRIKAKSDNNPQDQGSAISYARRYSLQSFLCMSAVDDDGEKATNHKQSGSSSISTGGTHNPISDSPIDSGTENQAKCEFCGSTNQYHAKTCPNFK